jgi:phospholipase D1/2
MGLKNEIVQTLCDRITTAFYDKEKKPFKVVVVVPLLPGFEGDPGDPGATVLRIQIHWQKVAIMSGNNSIYNTLKKTCPGINISDYLFFFGLRKW